MFNVVIDHVFPKVCPCCQERIAEQGECFCSRCQSGFVIPVEPVCPYCGASLDSALDLCTNCLMSLPNWTSGFTIWKFHANARLAIHRFKYYGETYWVRFFSQAVAEKYGQTFLYDNFDVITWIPLHWLKKLTRGYNQSEVFVRTLASNSNLPCKRLLNRVKWTCQQASLDRSSRLKNMVGAFEPESGALNWISDRRILVVDDVLTTGATLSEAVRALQKAGAESVSILSIARG